MKPGAAEFLAEFSKAGLPMGIATATRRELAEATLKRNGVWHYFCDIVTCIDAGIGKESPK